MFVAATRARAPRRGAMAVWIVLALSVIIGVVALGMDGGRMMEERRRAQASADAAALAAGVSFYEDYRLHQGTDPLGTARNKALAVAAANGYANDGVNSVVTVNIPPLSGDFAGRTEYAEVIVRSNLQAGFAGVFTRGPLVVQARAVARGRPAKIGMIALRATGDDAFLQTGNALVLLLDAPIVVNSDGNRAYNQSGNGILQASAHEITGNYSQSGILIGPVRTGVPPTADPFRDLPAPDPSAYPVRSFAQLSLSLPVPVVLSPGVYRGGIRLSGLAIVALLPGVYIMDGGGFEVSGAASLVGVGAVIYNTGGGFAGPLVFDSSGLVTLVAPVLGPYTGFSVFQARDVNQPVVLAGGLTTQIVGTVYAVRAAVRLTGKGVVAGATLGGSHVADTIELSGNLAININLGTNRPRVPDVGLVE